MARVCLEYAYTHRTGGQTPCAEVCLETKNLFPYGEQNIPTLGTKHSQPGNKTGFRLLASLLLMLVLGSTSVWGQKVADGVYYIKHDAGTSGIWYLWPSVTTNLSTGNAYLTTSNVTSLDEAVVQGVNNNQVGYGPFNKTYSHWIVKNVDGEESTIQLINPKLNKYVVIREKTYGDRDVWLADKPDDATISYSYFVINLDTPPYRISPFPGLNDVQTTDAYTFNSASGTDRAWLTWSEGGKDYSRSGEGRAGLIQFYNKDAPDKKGKPLWFFEPNLLDAPTISNVGANDVVTVTDANGLPEGYEIRYTTDGSNPTASSPVMEGNSFTVTSTFTLKAVVVRYGIVLTEVAEKAVAPAPCATPVITYDNSKSKVSIASTTPECTFYYTTDGTEPTTSSTKYSSPFSINSSTTVMAIATKSGYPNSEIASVKVVFNPTITLETTVYTYDGSEKKPGVSVKDGETTIPNNEYTVEYSNNTDAGVATVNIKDIAGDDLIVSGSANFTILRKAVTITANDASKAYNGTALTENGFTASELETGDTHTFTVVMTEGSTITNIGTEPNVIATVDGTDVTTGTETAIGNYLVTTANGTLTINPKAVTITANNASKAYDGTALTESGFTNTALETGDTHTFTVVMTEGSTITNIGTEPNVIATVDGTAVTTDTETAIGNYLVTTANGTLTITRKPLTITAGSDTKVYDSTPLTKNSYTHTVLLTGDKIEGVTVTGSQTDAGTSDNVLSAAVIKNSNNDDVTANYDITYTNGTLTVTPKPITIKADNKWKAYGEADPRLTYTSGGLLNNDAITGTLSRVAGENVGTYAITVGGLTAGDNYEISFTGANLTIVKAELTVTANNHTITYGDAPAGNGVTCEGFVGEETSAVLGGTLDYDFSYTQFGDVGNTYTIKPKGLTSSNYEITFSTGKLTVSPKEVGLTWSETTSFPYDGSPHAPTATATELVNGDKIGVTVSGAETNAGNSHTATASALTGTKKHNYKLPEANTQSFTITPKSIGGGTTLADGYTLNFGENNTILLTDDVIGSALVPSTDYSVGEDTDTNEGYSERNVTGKGNYTGSFTVRNASVAFSTDTEQDRWSGTFVAEKKNEGDIGFALPEGFTAFIISDIQGEWAIPEPLNYIPADVPVLLVANHQTQGFVVTEAESEKVTAITPDQKDKNMLEKVTEATSGYDPDTQSAPFGTKQIYLLYKNEFVFNKAGNLKKGKVYLNPNHTAPSPSPAPARLMIAWNHTTGIEDGRGKIEDGSSERWYTLDGRGLSGKPTTKGLYIVNGKKTVIK